MRKEQIWENSWLLKALTPPKHAFASKINSLHINLLRGCWTVCFQCFGLCVCLFAFHGSFATLQSSLVICRLQTVHLYNRIPNTLADTVQNLFTTFCYDRFFFIWEPCAFFWEIFNMPQHWNILKKWKRKLKAEKEQSDVNKIFTSSALSGAVGWKVFGSRSLVAREQESTTSFQFA